MKKLILAILFMVLVMMIVPTALAENEDDTQYRLIVMVKEGVDRSSVFKNDDVQVDLGIINGAAIMANPGRIKALSKDKNVISVETDMLATTSDYTPYKRLSWGVNRIDADMVWNHETIVGDVTTKDGATGTGIHVAILDTGIDSDHPDLKNLDKTNSINFVPPTNRAGRVTGTTDPTKWDDDNGHGTHCAGIVAGNEANTNNGMIGVAPEATLHAVKVLDSRGSGQYSWIIAGIDWCVNNDIHVISMSLSGSTSTLDLKTACDNAYEAGINIVAAAGNSGKYSVEYPASYDSVISVVAVDRYDKPASFNSWNEYVEIAAPGVDIYSTWNDGKYKTISGTSMACPHVAGIIALMIESEIGSPRAGLTGDDVGIKYTVNSKEITPLLVDALISCEFTDTFPPMVMEVGSTVTDTSATISFYTDEPSSSKVTLGTTDHTCTGTFSHSVTITGLTSGTKYDYTITATDEEENPNSGGADPNKYILSFTTTGGSTTDPTTSEMTVGSISATTKTAGPNKFIDTKVKIVDADGAGVSSATVKIEITLGTTSIATSSATTGTDGYASFSHKVTSSGTYTITVIDVSKDGGWTWDTVEKYTEVKF